ncbi:MAG: hypothetical protein JWQ66_3838 [Mucilaginibacter sp.]|nr:hypothetical protein [Mucilaginibacter sp.]
MKKGICLLILLTAIIAGCRKPYNPVVLSTGTGYLVVEGVINSGSDSTFIKLSRTVTLSGKTSASPELSALVTVEGDQNTSYPLKETGDGNYSCAGLNLNSSHKYRLDIKTSNGKQYLSDYVEVVNSPPIDSVHYDTQGSIAGPGLNIYADTHDATNQIRYFRWDYQETWIIHPAFESVYKSNGDTVLARDMVNDNIYTCWLSDTSSSIVLGSTAKLARSVITNNIITAIASTSEKLGDKYSIIVKQYALTPDAYNFFVNLKKNTEQLGSIFDAQPSEISGNIHSVSNPSEPVIGYVSVGSTSSQRVFIKKGDLSEPWVFTPFYSDCVIAKDDAHQLPCCYYAIPIGNQLVNQVDEFINFDKDGGYSNPLIPLTPIPNPGGPPLGYTATTLECADCTIRGSNKMPAFWK